MSRLGFISKAASLIILMMVAKSVAAEVHVDNFMVPLQVVEPARWLVQKSVDGESVRVSYRDLDLSNTVDVSKLYERLRSASKRVCGVSVRTQRPVNAGKNLCYTGVLAGAIAEVNLPSLHRHHSG
ncbi:MAG: UrcA family protein [Limisphaerales bacterium]